MARTSGNPSGGTSPATPTFYADDYGLSSADATGTTNRSAFRDAIAAARASGHDAIISVRTPGTYILTTGTNAQVVAATVDPGGGAGVMAYPCWICLVTGIRLVIPEGVELAQVAGYANASTTQALIAAASNDPAHPSQARIVVENYGVVNGNCVNTDATTTRQHGIALYNCVGPVVDGHGVGVVKNCKGTDGGANESFAIAVDRSVGARVLDNIVDRSVGGRMSSGISASYSSMTLIRGNECRNMDYGGAAGGNGITAFDAFGIQVLGNWTHDNAGKGINLELCDQYTVEGNISGGLAPSPYTGSVDIAYAASELYANGTGLQILGAGAGYEGFGSGVVAGNIIRGNAINVGIKTALSFAAQAGTVGTTVQLAAGEVTATTLGRLCRVGLVGPICQIATVDVAANSFTTDINHGGVAGDTVWTGGQIVDFAGNSITDATVTNVEFQSSGIAKVMDQWAVSFRGGDIRAAATNGFNGRAWDTTTAINWVASGVQQGNTGTNRIPPVLVDGALLYNLAAVPIVLHVEHAGVTWRAPAVKKRGRLAMPGTGAADAFTETIIAGAPPAYFAIRVGPGEAVLFGFTVGAPTCTAVELTS